MSSFLLDPTLRRSIKFLKKGEIAMEGAAATAIDVSEITTSVVGMFGDFTPANLLLFIAAGVGIAGGLVLTWFGVRYLTRKLMGALKKGRL